MHNLSGPTTRFLRNESGPRGLDVKRGPPSRHVAHSGFTRADGTRNALEMRMAKKTATRKDGKKTDLRPLTTDDLKAAIGGAGSSVPGNYGAKSSGGGGAGY